MKYYYQYNRFIVNLIISFIIIANKNKLAAI
jgi:hypothetical protein